MINAMRGLWRAETYSGTRVRSTPCTQYCIWHSGRALSALVLPSGRPGCDEGSLQGVRVDTRRASFRPVTAWGRTRVVMNREAPGIAPAFVEDGCDGGGFVELHLRQVRWHRSTQPFCLRDCLAG